MTAPRLSPESSGRYVHIDNVVYHLDDIEFDKDGKCAWTEVANALTHIKLCIEPHGVAQAPVLGREELARIWLGGTWFDGDASAFEGCGDHPEWLSALRGADALIAQLYPVPSTPSEPAQAAPWQLIETAPKEKWIIGYTSWGQQVGKFHEWVGPCEWVTDHFEFANTDFDVFPLPTHWQPWPAPKGTPAPLRDQREGGK